MADAGRRVGRYFSGGHRALLERLRLVDSQQGGCHRRGRRHAGVFASVELANRGRSRTLETGAVNQ